MRKKKNKIKCKWAEIEKKNYEYKRRVNNIYTLLFNSLLSWFKSSKARDNVIVWPPSPEEFKCNIIDATLSKDENCTCFGVGMLIQDHETVALNLGLLFIMVYQNLREMKHGNC